MRHFKVAALIFMLIATAAAAWHLGIFKTGYPKLETTPAEQQMKLIPQVEEQNDTAEKMYSESREQNKAVLQEEIEARYTAQLLNTAQDYEKELNNLANTAWEDYTKAQQEGGKISIQMAFPYITEGLKLKTKCDNEINTILQKFESELRANSLPVNKAKLCRQEYERRKSERKEAILEILTSI
jgi:Na+-translocating ferredoxin:NAD+ oxidoreductase RnfG subunit